MGQSTPEEGSMVQWVNVNITTKIRIINNLNDNSSSHKLKQKLFWCSLLLGELLNGACRSHELTWQPTYEKKTLTDNKVCN